MFCGDCGRSIADNAKQCPHCGQATDAVVASAPTGGAAVPVRVARKQIAGGRASSGLTRAEQAVYFRLARGFSWFLLIIISLAMVGNAVLLIPVVSQVVGTSTDVSAKDLTQAMSSPRSFTGEEEKELNPAEMAQLDQLAYEIIQLLPADMRPSENVDSLRGRIRNAVGGLTKEWTEQVAILKELRDVLREFPEADRKKAIDNYFGLKSQKIQLDRSKKAEAKASLVLLGSSMLSGIALLTFITMILVLLSIERNTRWSAG